MNTETIYKSPQGEKLMMEFYNRMLKNWPVEFTELDIDIPMGKTHVIVSGDDAFPPLVLLHGSTSNATTWAGDIKAYAAHFRVYAVDMPGEPGKSFHKRLSHSNEEYCDWLLQVFKALNLKKPNIVGLSFGGWLALKFASYHPDKIGKVVLIAPGGVVKANMRAIFKLIKYSSQGEKGIDKTLQLFFPDDFESPEVREFFALLNENFVTRTDAVKSLPDETLKKVTAPVFMICGTNDCFFNFKKAKRRIEKLIPHSETILYKKGYHGLFNMAEVIIPHIKP